MRSAVIDSYALIANLENECRMLIATPLRWQLNERVN